MAEHHDCSVTWRDLPPHPLFSALRLHVLTAYRHRLDQHWSGEHRHDHFNRLYFAVDGHAKLCLPGRCLDIVPGNLYLIPAFTTHRHHCSGHLTLFWSHFTATVDGERGLFEAAPGIHVHAAPSVATTDLFARLCVAAAGSSSSDVVLRSALILELLAPFARVAEEANHHDRERFLPVLAALDDHPEGSHSITKLAALVDMSPDHFTRRFRTQFGLTPARYKQRRRLALAQRLLWESDVTIDAVARRCGFCDGFHLSKVFRRELGTSPSTYRARGHTRQP
jgi:AraC-like DNA-binding protein